jgi:ankyrin repeat protein
MAHQKEKKMLNDIDTRARSDCIKILIENNANLNLKDMKQQTPLHIAAANRAEECVQLLVENGAYVNERDLENKIALHRILEPRNVNILGEVHLSKDQGTFLQLFIFFIVYELAQ